MRKMMLFFCGLVLVAALATSMTAGMVSAQDKAAASAPAWLFNASEPAYAPSQYTTTLNPADVKNCPGEPVGSCLTARAQRMVVVNGKEMLVFAQFPFLNSTACRMDGYYYDQDGIMVTGIPTGKLVWAEGFTYRPHECSSGALATSSSTSTVSVTVYPMNGWAVNDGERSRVRQSASFSGTIISFLDPGTPITLTAKTDVWYQMESGFIHEVRVQFTEPLTTAAAATTTTTTTVVETTTPAASTPPCVTAPDTLKWTAVNADEWSWNTYRDSDGSPVEMTIDRQQDGEYIGEDGAHSPIPAGTWMVTGMTARCGGK